VQDLLRDLLPQLPRVLRQTGPPLSCTERAQRGWWKLATGQWHRVGLRADHRDRMHQLRCPPVPDPPEELEARRKDEEAAAAAAAEAKAQADAAGATGALALWGRWRGLLGLSAGTGTGAAGGVVPTADAAPAADGQDDGAAAATAPQGEDAGEGGAALFTRRQSSNDGASQGSALHVSKAAADAPDLEADPFSAPSAHAPAASTSAGEEGEGAAVAGEEGEGAAVAGEDGVAAGADDASWVSSGLGSSHAAAAADQPLLPPTAAHNGNGATADAPAAPAPGAGALDAAWSVLTGMSRSAEDEAWEPSLPGTDFVTGEVRPLFT
jgi:hypothetical protein